MIPNEVAALTRQGTITENLSNAIDQYIMSCAIRNIRGDRMKPMSMLVHVTHKIDDMKTLKEIITGYISNIKGRYKSRHHNEILKLQFLKLWGAFESNLLSINEELGLNNLIPQYDQIWLEIKNVFDILRVIELNSDSEDELDYSSGEEIKVLAIGGNQLSRGLTLEGLMMSYYLRQSMQYDTLLQMGRWFGYRKSYEDLTRIYTTQRIWDFFEHLALVEQELRSAIYKYEEDGKTPAELAIAIRDHRTLNITSRNKMGAGQPKQTSFSESLNQTIWLPLDKPEILLANYNLGDAFIRKVQGVSAFDKKNGSWLAKEKLKADFVISEFLSKYIFVSKESASGPGLDNENMLKYIVRRISFSSNPELLDWSFAVISNAGPNYPGDPISYGGLSLNRVGRSRKHTIEGYNIGVLTESAHLRIDLKTDASSPYDDRSSKNPLLLLYLISKDSKAVVQRDNPLPNERIDLFRSVTSEQLDVLGIAIVLPKSQVEPNDYIGQ